MSNRQTHIIQRQILEVDVSNEEEHWRWQERLSRFSREAFVPQLELLLDRLSVPGEVIRIEKLEVSTDFIAGKNWEQMLVSDLLRQVEEQLSTAEPAAPAQAGISRASTDETRMGQFLFFLKNGVLPWSAPVGVRQHFEQEMIAVFEKTEPGRWSPELHEVLKNENIRRRLSGQFSTGFLKKVIQVFFEKNAPAIFENHRSLKDVIKKTGLASLEKMFWTEALGAAGRSDESAAVFQKTILRFLNKNPEEVERLLAVPEVVKTGLPAETARLLETLKKTPGQIDDFLKWLKSRQGSLEELQAFLKKNGSLPPDFIKQRSAARPSPESPEPELEKTAASLIVDADSLYLANAGLVLLHPFLPAFFEELNVVKKGRMLNPQRAVHLLQYLATGQTATPEFELPLNKLLCGIPLAGPLEAGIRLTPKEKKEAKHLLEAVIRHWSILKNTSPEGLQGTYLCREGKLSRKGGEDWQLHVEQKGFDILLADLPWSISVVKLPWMTGMIWVEWQ